MSWRRLAGKHWVVVMILSAWILVVFVVTTLSTACVVLVAGQLVPLASQTLPATIFAIGVTSLVWAIINLFIQLFSAMALSALLYSVWKTYGGPKNKAQHLSFEKITGQSYSFFWSIRTVTFIVCFCLLVALLVGSAVTPKFSFDNTVYIIGHRGAGGVAPENTRVAIEQAILAGAQWVEIDVQETAYGEVVVIHDSDLMKIAGVDLKVWDASVEGITSVDIGTSFHPKFHDELVPKLQEIL